MNLSRNLSRSCTGCNTTIIGFGDVCPGESDDFCLLEAMRHVVRNVTTAAKIGAIPINDKREHNLLTIGDSNMRAEPSSGIRVYGASQKDTWE